MSQKGVNLLARAVEHISSPAHILVLQGRGAGLQGMVFDDEIQHQVVFKNVDIGIGFRRRNEHPLHRPTGHVVGVDNAVPGMPALPAKIEGSLRSRAVIERHAEFGQLAYTIRTIVHDHLNDVRMTQTVPGVERVLDVQLKRIIGTEYRSYPALCIVGTRLKLVLLGHHGNGATFGGLQSKSKAGNAAADHKQIKLMFHGNPQFHWQRLASQRLSFPHPSLPVAR